MKKYLERIKKEKEEDNEYNRASITEYQINQHHQRNKIGPNEGNVLRVLNKNDTSSKNTAYVNKTRIQNEKRVQDAVGGMKKFNDLCYLQVKGMNQLQKEIEETKSIKVKTFNFDALHTNKETGEVEGIEDYNIHAPEQSATETLADKRSRSKR